ncbi:MAG: phosphate signaling complex protein PhoU [Sphingobacteriia bacterium]|nr:phosphate signaling complex protein PhoU [Sphingobacteriia bacterium]NCC39915.1 phosphate signaling complex protein PhoU [Gammaproteobacteria bacterium]
MDEPVPAKAVTEDLASGHLVQRYDRELAGLRGIILDMGQRVVEQTRAAALALIEGDAAQAYRVLDREPQIDYLSLDADEEIFRVIARRQPTAVDLRIVLALFRIASDVERAGDKTVRIANQALALGAAEPEPKEGPDEVPSAELRVLLRGLEEHARGMLEQSIEAVARFNVVKALGVFENESALFEASARVRQHLGQDGAVGLRPDRILCLLTAAHALERIGNHASNIAEQVIYVAEGKDIRYRNREILIETLRHGHAF